MNDHAKVREEDWFKALKISRSKTLLNDIAQALADQRERDAVIAESNKFAKTFDVTQAMHNIVCDEIAIAIRNGGK